MHCGKTGEGIILVHVVGIVTTEVSRVKIRPIILQKVHGASVRRKLLLQNLR